VWRRGWLLPALTAAVDARTPHTCQVTRDRANSWSIEHAKGWSVMSESSHFFYDLLNTEPAIARAFGHKWFRSALITSEDLDAGATPGGGSSSSSPDSSSAGGSSSSKDGAGGSDGDEPKGLVNIRCRFTLPPESAADELQQMVVSTSVCVCVCVRACVRACVRVCVRACVREAECFARLGTECVWDR
jgi:hypothetical protein